MEQWARRAPWLLGWGSILFGGAVLAAPRRLGKLLYIDTSRRDGLILAVALAVRDLGVGALIVRAKDAGTRRLGVTLRIVSDTSDFLMYLIDGGIFLPGARKLAAAIPPILAVELWTLARIRD